MTKNCDGGARKGIAIVFTKSYRTSIHSFYEDYHFMHIEFTHTLQVYKYHT